MCHTLRHTLVVTIVSVVYSKYSYHPFTWCIIWPLQFWIIINEDKFIDSLRNANICLSLEVSLSNKNNKCLLYLKCISSCNYNQKYLFIGRCWSIRFTAGSAAWLFSLWNNSVLFLLSYVTQHNWLQDNSRSVTRYGTQHNWLQDNK